MEGNKTPLDLLVEYVEDLEQENGRLKEEINEQAADINKLKSRVKFGGLR